jgi:hypothetical protein
MSAERAGQCGVPAWTGAMGGAAPASFIGNANPVKAIANSAFFIGYMPYLLHSLGKQRTRPGKV